jgi:hypothetical protein
MWILTDYWPHWLLLGVLLGGCLVWHPEEAPRTHCYYESDTGTQCFATDAERGKAFDAAITRYQATRSRK